MPAQASIKINYCFMSGFHTSPFDVFLSLDLSEICSDQVEAGIIRRGVVHDGDLDTARKVFVEGSQGWE